ncbi:uncharacterized protein LOC115884862 [Sitophilus oryzae]|uniref:Uncharacterized protein LOC115884862 n=1 Tax=Sitophilus oryzae TaxID=7048 RepID=A0A6J2Y6G8_SITOR|nr:uncharacterized protein LOC115884862 [Sitophilus oryzae]
MEFSGDIPQSYIPPHPDTSHRPARVLFRGNMSRRLSQVSGNALYWIMQILILLTSISFNILCNPIVWFLVKTIFNVVSEVLIYMVLGICSVLISIITHLDEYYTKGKHQGKSVLNDTDYASYNTEVPKNVKRFVDVPKDYSI